MKSTFRIYILTLLILFAVFGYSIVRAFYYLFAGVNTFSGTLYNLPQWIIPYAPIGLSLILVTILIRPLRIFEDEILHAISFIAGIAAFAGFELLFEKIPALSNEKLADIYSAQTALCIAPVKEFYPTGVPELFSPVVRIHFYVVSILLILIFTKVILDGFLAVENKRGFSSAYFVRLTAGVVLLFICIIGNITDFFRNGSRDLPLASVILIISFFIVQSVVMGLVVVGFCKQNYIVAPIVSVLTCIVVYIGEYFVLGGYFYRLGKGAFFNGIFSSGQTINSSLAPADICVILLSGLLSFILCLVLKPFKTVSINYEFGRGVRWK